MVASKSVMGGVPHGAPSTITTTPHSLVCTKILFLLCTPFPQSIQYYLISEIDPYKKVLNSNLDIVGTVAHDDILYITVLFITSPPATSYTT